MEGFRPALFWQPAGLHMDSTLLSRTGEWKYRELENMIYGTGKAHFLGSNSVTLPNVGFFGILNHIFLNFDLCFEKIDRIQ